MILIEESAPPRKLSGLSSFLISFQYDEKIIEKIKQLDVYYYHKKDYRWEIPENELAEVLDSLTFLDDITLRLTTGYEPAVDYESAKSELPWLPNFFGSPGD